MTTSIEKKSQAQQEFYLNLFKLDEKAQVKEFEKAQQDKEVLEHQQEKDLDEVGFETETIEDTYYNRVVVFKCP
jgi:hypothetical protein